MPRYDFRCRQCGETFELQRPMQNSADPAECPAGHTDTVKLLAAVGLSGAAASRTSAAPRPGGGGGCCGGGCCGG